MALKTRREHFGVDTHINTTHLYSTSRLVARLTGFVVPPNKAIVGDNAFSHEAGIHQHGVLCDKRTYEIIRPQDVGAPESKLVLGKHSGRHAFGERIKSLGYHLTEEELAKAFVLFKDLCDKKGIVSDGDIEALIVDEILGNATKKSFELRDFMISIGAGGRGSATVVLADGEKTNSDAATGNGPVDAAYKAIQRIIGIEPELVSYKISAVSERSDAVGEAVVVIKFKEILAQGRGASTDVIEASIKAYINAINRLVQIAEARGINLFPQCVPA
ncbi:alpha-isopropylmalate synthase regulatory domain-containing protein [Acetomicrobium flavidum]